LNMKLKLKNMKKTTLILLALMMSMGVFAQEYFLLVKDPAKEGWMYVDIEGVQLGDQDYKKCYSFTEDGLAVVIDGKKIFFLNTKGEKVIPEMQNFTMLSAAGMFGGNRGFQNGLLAVKRSERWGYLDTQGKLAIPLKYTRATNFDNGHAIVAKGDKYFVIDKKGTETEINMEDIAKIQHFSEGLVPFYSKKKKWGYLGTDGKVAIEAQFKAIGYFHNGYAWARDKKGKYGYIDKKGNWILEPIYDSAKDFDKESGLARVKLKGKWGYVNSKGDFLKVDTEKWGDFRDGLAKGRKDGHIGFYDNTGKWVIEPILQGSRNFKNGYCAAKKDEMWGLINKEGEWVIEPRYTGIKDVEKVD